MANREIRKSRIAGAKEKSPSGDIGKAMRQGSTGTGKAKDVGAGMRQGATGSGHMGGIISAMHQTSGSSCPPKSPNKMHGPMFGHNRAGKA